MVFINQSPSKRACILLSLLACLLKGLFVKNALRYFILPPPTKVNLTTFFFNVCTYISRSKEVFVASGSLTYKLAQNSALARFPASVHAIRDSRSRLPDILFIETIPSLIDFRSRRTERCTVSSRFAIQKIHDFTQ